MQSATANLVDTWVEATFISRANITKLDIGKRLPVVFGECLGRFVVQRNVLGGI
jgi:hypothetical protein